TDAIFLSGYQSCVCSVFFFFSSRRRHTRLVSDWSSDVCSSDLAFAHNFWPNESPLGKHIAVGTLPLAEIVSVTRNVKNQSLTLRSEERRVGKECRSRLWRYH